MDFNKEDYECLVTLVDKDKATTKSIVTRLDDGNQTKELRSILEESDIVLDEFMSEVEKVGHIKSVLVNAPEGLVILTFYKKEWKTDNVLMMMDLLKHSLETLLLSKDDNKNDDKKIILN